MGLSVSRAVLVEVLEDEYRALGWDVEGAPPRRSAPGSITTREIDHIADAIIVRIKNGSLVHA